MKVISKAEAAILGLKRYFTGEPCHRGHICERRTKGGGCIECTSIRGKLRYEWNREKQLADNKKWRNSNKERHKELIKIWRAKNPKKENEYAAKHYWANREKCLQRTKERRKSNPQKYCMISRESHAKNKDKIREYQKIWVKENSGICASHNAKRRAKKKRATPIFANIEEIKAIYQKAQYLTLKTGTKYVVDHIVPLTSPIVCGLHCSDNLQVITELENARKGNLWWPNMP